MPCGACYCFWARELGAREAFGFDVHDHWMRVALVDLVRVGVSPYDLTRGWIVCRYR